MATSVDYHPYIPILGLLLLAPFEPGQNFDTMLPAFRWIGSPVSSLAYIFWNMKVTGRCALLIAMATRYDQIPDKSSGFADMRDSLWVFVLRGCLNR